MPDLQNTGHLWVLGLVLPVLVFLWTMGQRLGEWRSKAVARVIAVVATFLTLLWIYLALLWLYGIDLFRVPMPWRIGIGAAILILITIGAWSSSRKNSAIEVAAPLICPERYIPVKTGNLYSSIMFVNDSDSVAYSLSIEPIKFDNWTITLSDIHRIGAREKASSNLLVIGQNTTPDLSWALGLWHKAHMQMGTHGPYVDLPPLQMQVHYRGETSGDRYLSLCEIWRNANDPTDDGIHLRLLRRERA